MNGTALKIHAENSPLLSGLRTLEIEYTGIKSLINALSYDSTIQNAFLRATSTILTMSGRLIVTGIGKSGHIGRKIAATFASTGTPAHFVHTSEAAHGDLGMIQRGDVVLALSRSGTTDEFLPLIEYTKRFHIPLIAITRSQSILGIQASICLAMPDMHEACPNKLAPTTSTTMQLALGDALAVAVLEERGFSQKDFYTLHPGGQLGARLRKVKDFMHSATQIPRVHLNNPMSEALITMTEKGFGCAFVTEEDHTLLGVITDGDLRRHMHPDLLSFSAQKVMTPHPHSIGYDALLGEALAELERHKIMALAVVDCDNKLVGLIHMLDLLRANVI
jgi:arabinose-5-phosphate isomerase